MQNSKVKFGDFKANVPIFGQRHPENVCFLVYFKILRSLSALKVAELRVKMKRPWSVAPTMALETVGQSKAD
jgi:hypothetical protein